MEKVFNLLTKSKSQLGQDIFVSAYTNKNSKIFLAGHNGMVGSSIYKHLKKNKYPTTVSIFNYDLARFPTRPLRGVQYQAYCDLVRFPTKPLPSVQGQA